MRLEVGRGTCAPLFSGTAMARILIIDDHSIFREGIKQILGETPDLRVEAEAPTGREGLRFIEEGGWDAVVMDLSMPDGGGLEALAQIRTLAPSLPVLILSMFPEEQYGLRVLKAGAAGYLSKMAAPDQLVNAIRKVAGGGRFISPSLAEQLAERLVPQGEGAPHERLSDREFQVMTLLAEGKTVSEIADELALSVKTISTYRTRVLEKMDLGSNASLTRYALDFGLIE